MNTSQNDAPSISECAQGEEQFDVLTGLLGHKAFRAKLTSVLESKTPDTSMAVIYFNIQNFKGYNEKYGFEAGDELLLLISEAVKDAFHNQPASRFQSDQFVALSPAHSALPGVRSVRRRFREKHMDSSIWLKAGVYIIEPDDMNAGVVCDRAKLACDAIKGRRDVFYRTYDEELKREIELHRYVLDHFDEALENHWVKVFYQPIIRVATGEICDEEALARWVDPEQGLISPADFIPVLEEARLINKLDLYIVRRVCENFSRMRADKVPVVPVSINLSRLDFELCDIVSEVDTILSEFGMTQEMLSIEVTESALSGNREFLSGAINRFRSLGHEVWMDDFGSGFSSLNTLKDYSFDLIKIDMGFLEGFGVNEQTHIMLAHMISMIKDLGMKTLVEGVETQPQLDYLRSLGLGRAQGYLIGRPMSLDDFDRAAGLNEMRVIEKVWKREFYEDVGRVNLMRPDPVVSPDGVFVPGDTSAAILRRRQGTYEYLNVSYVYSQSVKTMGLSGIEESLERLNDPHRIEHVRMDEAVDEARDTEDWCWASYYDNGVSCTLRMRRLTSLRYLDVITVLVIVDDVNLAAHVKYRGQ